ncbi:MAG: hypothetical protein UHX00_06845 [Caryophanon sp.]|nr:hypothetical protein [Caryophanon sp.]
MIKSKFYIVHVYSPIIVGALIYTLFREDGLLIFRMYEQLFFSEWLTYVRQYTMDLYVSSYVMYTLPDALWVYAFTSFMCINWVHEQVSMWRTVFLLLPLLLGAGSEVAQYVLPVLGTFDIADLWSMVLAYLVAYSIVKYMKKGVV